jgi:hypothetical protein
LIRQEFAASYQGERLNLTFSHFSIDRGSEQCGSKEEQ